MDTNVKRREWVKTAAIIFLAVLLGAATVILAMGAGKLGAKSIDEALSK